MDRHRPGQRPRHPLPSRPRSPRRSPPDQENMPRSRNRAPPPYQFGQDGGRDSYRPRDPHGRDQFQPGQFNLGNHRTYNPNPSQPRPSQRSWGNKSQNQARNGDGAAQPQREPPKAPRRMQHQGPPRRYPSRKLSARPLLSARRSPTPEQLRGMNTAQPKFKALEDVSEAEEDDEDIAQYDGGNDSDGSQPPRKKIVMEFNKSKATTEAAPKWSNPDPYTSLPPPSEATGKRTDVLGFIRKARLVSTKDGTNNRGGNDFISLNDEEPVDQDSSALNGYTSSVTGSDRQSSNKSKRTLQEISDQLTPEEDLRLERDLAKKSQQKRRPFFVPDEDEDSEFDRKVPVTTWPPSRQLDGPSGRKRPREEISDHLTSLEALEHERSLNSKSQRRNPKKAVGIIEPPWAPKSQQPRTPWFDPNGLTSPDGIMLLHKEICDFYDYVKPRSFENDMRQNLIDRVQHFLDSFYRGCTIRYFGSFAAGIYLPNADMDLVVLSPEFLHKGLLGQFRTSSSLHRFKARLDHLGLAKENSIAVIAKAKVPLVKYVDRLTGIRVDISFDNDTGLAANNTYKVWTKQYPAMPVLVSLVKQFLMMRNLNEVRYGGLGGFAVTCLVVSFLHLEIKGIDPTKNFGETFLRLLDFYGNRFDTTRNGIRLDPPAYFSKANAPRLRKPDKDENRLCVIDPNREDNNISGGSKDAHLIFKAFSDATAVLESRMQEACNAVPPTSILECLFAGDYSNFENQRDLLKKLSGT